MIYYDRMGSIIFKKGEYTVKSIYQKPTITIDLFDETDAIRTSQEAGFDGTGEIPDGWSEGNWNA